MPRQTDDRATNRRETNSMQTDSRHTMADVNHTNPKTGEAFGDSQVFERGKIAVVDGGEADSRDDDHEDEPMGEIDHTPRKDAPDVNEVYDRGAEEAPAGESDSDETDAEADV